MGKKVFISYVREDSDAVDKLATSLRSHGVDVWVDRTHLGVGVRWKDAIRTAIRNGDYFLAFFSQAFNDRPRTYMMEELHVAVDELRQRPRERAWFLPISYGLATLPEHPIGSGETIRDLHCVDLAADWDGGISNLLRVLSQSDIP